MQRRQADRRRPWGLLPRSCLCRSDFNPTVAEPRVGMNSDLRGPTCRLRLVAREPFATIACFLDEATPDVIGIPCARAFDSFHFNGRFGRLVDFVGVRCRTFFDQWALDGSCCTCHKVAGHCVTGNAGSLFRSRENGVHGMSHSTFVACAVLSFEIFSRDPRQKLRRWMFD